MKIILNLLLLFSVNCFAIDGFISDQLAWDDKELAADISDYSMIGMMAAPYLLGEKKQWGTIAVTQSVNWLLTDIVKMRVNRERPNGEDNRSFFSGHTSTAFTSAGLLCAMKKHCTEALIVASMTGYLRIAAKKHYLTDVIVGAGIGYAAGRYIPTIVIQF